MLWDWIRDCMKVVWNMLIYSLRQSWHSFQRPNIVLRMSFLSTQGMVMSPNGRSQSCSCGGHYSFPGRPWFPFRSPPGLETVGDLLLSSSPEAFCGRTEVRLLAAFDLPGQLRLSYTVSPSWHRRSFVFAFELSSAAATCERWFLHLGDVTACPLRFLWRLSEVILVKNLPVELTENHTPFSHMCVCVCKCYYECFHKTYGLSVSCELWH